MDSRSWQRTQDLTPTGERHRREGRQGMATRWRVVAFNTAHEPLDASRWRTGGVARVVANEGTAARVALKSRSGYVKQDDGTRKLYSAAYVILWRTETVGSLVTADVPECYLTPWGIAHACTGPAGDPPIRKVDQATLIERGHK